MITALTILGCVLSFLCAMSIYYSITATRTMKKALQSYIGVAFGARYFVAEAQGKVKQDAEIAQQTAIMNRMFNKDAQAKIAAESYNSYCAIRAAAALSGGKKS